MTLREQTRGFSEDYWCPTESGDAVSDAAVPLVDGALWLALLKLSNGDTIAPAERDWLLAQNMAQVIDGVTSLTARGRSALGLSL